MMHVGSAPTRRGLGCLVALLPERERETGEHGIDERECGCADDRVSNACW